MVKKNYTFFYKNTFKRAFLKVDSKKRTEIMMKNTFLDRIKSAFKKNEWIFLEINEGKIMYITQIANTLN